MKLPHIYSDTDLENLVEELGFLPFFAHRIRGFSVEECCPAALWFARDTDGPWEWKGPVARRRRCVYGKLFGGKAGFVSLAWLPDLVNYRRDGYDFDTRYEEGLSSRKDKEIYDTLTARGTLLSRDLKKLCGYRKGGNTGFNTVITRLQMQTYVVTSDFRYLTDKTGQPYGWGVACYSTPEELFGYDTVTAAYEQRTPQASLLRMMAHLSRLCPDASEDDLLRLLR